MEKSIIDEKIYQDLISQVSEQTIEQAEQILKSKKLNITKVIYDNNENFELHASIKLPEKYYIYIKVAEGEVENLSCTCDEYKKSYCACEHIIGAVKEFIRNPDYIRIFAGYQDANNKIVIEEKEDSLENYKMFNQMLKEFYNSGTEEELEYDSKKAIDGTIHIEPKIIYSKFNNSMKLEIKIGEKQMYKVKSLPEFYDRFLNEEKYKYGAKLEFIHTRDQFVEEDRKILDFVLKYAEIIKYANESSNGYDYYTKRLRRRCDTSFKFGYGRII